MFRCIVDFLYVGVCVLLASIFGTGVVLFASLIQCLPFILAGIVLFGIYKCVF